MSKSVKRRPTGVWVTLGILLLLVALIYGGFWVLRAEQAKLTGVTLLEPARALAPFELVDMQGERYTLDNLRGRWSVLFFGFTHCPDVCPTTLAVMDQTIAELSAPVLTGSQFLLVTVDADRDTPERLQDYLAGFNPAIGGVTGDTVSLTNFRKSLGVYAAEAMDSDGDVAHSAALFLVNPEGQFAGLISAPVTVETLAWALNRLAG